MNAEDAGKTQETQKANPATRLADAQRHEAILRSCGSRAYWRSCGSSVLPGLLLAVGCLLSAGAIHAQPAEPVEWRPSQTQEGRRKDAGRTQETFPASEAVLRSCVSCAESSHAFDVRKYEISVRTAITSGACTAQARITLTSRMPGLDSLALMMDSLICDSVKHNGVLLQFQRPTGWLVFRLETPLPQGESTQVEVFYRRRSGIPNRGYFYIARGTYSPQCYTVAAPYDARFWFPCYDEPFDKAEQGCCLNITVPDSFSVCANGLLDSVQQDTALHTKTFFWKHRFPISTYLIVFAASRWSEYVQYYHQGLPDSVKVRTFFWIEDSSYVYSLLRNLPDMLTFYCDTAMFGPYPFERYGQVFVTGFQYGGMENQTLTMLALFLINESTVSHELSHMWWGDMVTCVDYRNVWLNEGFATYWDALYSERRSGHSSFLSIMTSRAQSYFSEDAGHRFATYDPALADVYAWGTIYCKGSWLQHMLRYIEGDTTAQHGVFFRALRAYGDSFKYGSASSQDYERIHEQATGLNLDWFFNEWLYQAGYPQYRFAWSAEATGPFYRVITNLSQNNGNLAPPVFHMPVQLLFRTVHPDTLESLAVLQVHTSPQADTFLVSFQPESIRFDPGKWLLKKVTMAGIAEAGAPNAGCGLRIDGPTPGRDRVWFDCQLPEPGALLIYDRSGRRVAGYRLAAGETRLDWNCADLPAGVYLARLAAAGRPTQAASLKLVVSR